MHLIVEDKLMTDRFDKFTERARKALQLAQEEAQRLNHNYIGTEHILLGLVREGEGIGAKVLTALNVSTDEVRRQVLQVLRSSSGYSLNSHRPLSDMPGEQSRGGFFGFGRQRRKPAQPSHDRFDKFTERARK